MKVRTFATEELSSVYVAAIVEYLVTMHPKPVLGLATGSTPVRLYQRLIDFYRQGESFAHVTAINLDEYVGLPMEHPQSYHRFMREHLFDWIDIPRDRIFMPDGMADDLKAECARFDAILNKHPIDLQILGIGHNGHIGFNEPDLSLNTRTHVIELTQDTLAANSRFFVHKADMPTRAMNMGIQSILRAKHIILMAFGEDKASAVQRSLSGQISTDVPASILQAHPNVTFVLDQGAASLLSASSPGGQ